jgi:uncharacterized damage-inducible protein DinB
MHRRKFIKQGAIWACAAAVPVAARDLAAAQDSRAEPNVIGPRPGYTPQIGTLVSMLTWMRGQVLGSLEGLTTAQLDYLHDEKANTIGALLLHLAATERLYQIHTFEGRKWNDWDSETQRNWLVPMNLGPEARRTIKGRKLSHYVATLERVREDTLKELRKRDDDWLMAIDRDWSWGPTNNYCKWFHVCEHESNHNGQIKWLKSRLPA